MQKRLIILSVVLGFFQWSYSAERTLPVIPTPKQVEWYSTGLTAVTKQPVLLKVSRDLRVNTTAVDWLREELVQAWQARFVADGKTRQPAKVIQVILDSNQVYAPKYLKRNYSPAMGAEGYFLQIGTDSVTIMAATRRGLFYGVTTLVQLLRAHGYQLPGVLICDYPSFAWRGISDDLARGQVSTIANFKKIIRYLAEQKYNIYMPYFEDLLRMEQFPTIGVGRGALTKDEVRQLQDYARQCQVEIIPIFQTLGHFENILNQPEFMGYADYPGAASLNVLSESARQFLFTMLDEVIPWFDSPFFHIGADESWDVGMGATREAAAQWGIAKLHADHYRRVYQKVREHGKKVMMYGDIILRHPEILGQIPKDIMIVDWHYLPNDVYPSVKQFADSGFQVLVSPAVHNWHNPFPHVANTWLNIGNIARVGYTEGAQGLIVSGWGDFGSPNLRELNYLGYAFGAEAAWNPEASRYETVNQRFGQQYFGIDDAQFNSVIWHLSEIANQTNFKEVWRQPFYPSEEPVNRLLTRALLLQQHSEAARELIPTLKEKAQRNSDDFDYWLLSARIGSWVGERLLVARQVETWRNTTEPNDHQSQQVLELEARCSQLICELTDIEEEYKRLWLRTNLPDNLPRIINLFRQQCAYLEEARDALRLDRKDFPIALTSQFIAAPAQPSKDLRPEPIYLRKKFVIKDLELIKEAHLQFIAHSDAQVFLNGKKIGRVVATRSLSLLVENQRVGWYEVLPHLVAGENWLALEVCSYRPQLPTAANVYLEIVYQDGARRIIKSDADWEASLQVKNGWETGRDRETVWQKAVVQEKWPWKISAPLFHRGFCSRIEF